MPRYNDRGTLHIDPLLIHFTHARIRPVFSGCVKGTSDGADHKYESGGMRIEESISRIIEGTDKVTDVPLISVMEINGAWFSLNNRRLYMFKQLRRKGYLENNEIECYKKEPLERERKKYSVENCALEAKLMGGSRSVGADACAAADCCASAGANDAAGDGNADAHDGVAVAVNPTNPTAATVFTALDPVAVAAVNPAVKAARVKNLDPSIVASVKQMRKLVAKGKFKEVLSEIDEWLMLNLVDRDYLDVVLETIGMDRATYNSHTSSAAAAAGSASCSKGKKKGNK